MAEIKRVNGQVIVDYMARDYDSLLRSMRQLIPYKLPEWTEYESEADFGNVLLQLFAHMGDILSYYQDRVANESFLGTAQTRRSIIQHLGLIGYRLGTAAPASALLTLYLPADCNETLKISRGDAFATKSTKDSPSIRFEYTAEEPLTIDCSTLPEVDDSASTWNGKIYRDSIPVEEGRLVENEIVGTSIGTPNQRFHLAHAGLILRGLRPQDPCPCLQSKEVNQSQVTSKDITLWTELGTQKTEWTLQESLAFSRAGQKDFVVSIDEKDQTTIIFGDGTFGAIPQANEVIRATYRVGGGTQGNVGARSIQTIADAPQLLLLGAEVFNPKAATGGAARESITHAVQHAPTVFRSLKRAVTAADYKALALNFSGVGKVRVEATNWNTVTLYVAPEDGGDISDVLKANLKAYFEDKRPLTTSIEVEGVEYVKIYVTAEIEVKSFYSEESVKKQVQKAGRSVLAFKNVDFGKTIYLSKFYEAIEAIEGVFSVNIDEFRAKRKYQSLPTEEVAKKGKIKLAEHEVPIIPDDSVDPVDPVDPDSNADYLDGIKVISKKADA